MVKAAPDVDVRTLIRDEREALHTFEHETEVGLDLETGGLDPWRNPLAVTILHGRKTGKIAVLHNRGKVSRDLKQFLEKPDRTFVGHNVASFDMPFLHTHGVDIQKAKWWDTLVSESVIASSARRSVSASLKASLSRRVGVSIKKDQDHSGWMNPELTDNQLQYAGGDVRYIFDLKDEHIRKAEADGCMEHLMLEHDIVPVVAGMTCNGLPFNTQVCNEFLDYRRSQIDRLQPEFDRAFGGPINLGSHVQVKKFFKQMFDLDLASSDMDTMNDLARVNGSTPLGQWAANMVEWRQAKQNLKVYTPSWIERFVYEGWVHARFWQCSAETGRFTSTNPNLQQVPRVMRKVFGNLPGWKIISADYSQIEVRIAADIAGDEDLLAALAAEDIHKAVASMVWQIPVEEVDKEMRKLAKAQSFRLLFGGGARGLMEEAHANGSDISFEEAQELVGRFFARFKGVYRHRQHAYNTAKRRQAVAVTLPLGMRRILAGPKLTGMTLLNTGVQGTAGVGLKCGLRQCRKAGLSKYLGSTVHDEVVAAVPDKEAEEYGVELDRAMVRGMQEVTDAPVITEVKIADMWLP